MIRALIADDSETARAHLTSILSDDPEIEVVALARDGVEAVALAERRRPDVILMDIHMPEMNGFDATKRIMTEHPTPIVIISGVVDIHEVKVSMRAFHMGALALVGKPRGGVGAEAARDAASLRETVKAMAAVKVVRHRVRFSADEEAPPVPGGNRAGTVRSRARVLAIAASTGGPAALERILAALPGDFAVPILVVQHIARGFLEGLAAWLNDATLLSVGLAENGDQPMPGHVYLPRDDHHLGIGADGRLLLSPDPAINGFRPSATYLFRSVAAAFGPAAIGVILTGMGDDGVEGLRAMRRQGARIVAQDRESAIVHGMPGAAIAAGLPHDVLPLNRMASHLRELVC